MHQFDDAALRHTRHAASELTADRVVIHLDWRPELCIANSVLHGGVVIALAAGGARRLEPPRRCGRHADHRVEDELPRRGPGGRDGHRDGNTAARPGRSTIVVKTELQTADGKLVATTTQTQSVLRPA